MTWLEGSEVARGATAVVTRGTEGVVVKTFEPFVPFIAAQIEAAGAKAAADAGLPVPAYLGLDEGPPARIAMSFVEAQPLADAIPSKGPGFVGHELARCQDLVRNARVPAGIGVLRVATLYGYQLAAGPLPAGVVSRLQGELAAMPEGDAFCHLDLHPLNILFDGENSTIIDWMNARIGPAGADVARTRIILESLPHYLGTSPETHGAITILRQAYEETTKKLSARAWEESHAWLRICRAARLAERVCASEREALLAAEDFSN